MKVRDGLYFCPWCSIEIKQQVNVSSDEKFRDQVICPKCLNRISQKTELEIRMRIERGFKV